MSSHQASAPIRPAHLRPRQVAVRHGISESTVRRWIADGKLKAVRVNRSVFVTVESLDRLFRGDQR